MFACVVSVIAVTIIEINTGRGSFKHCSTSTDSGGESTQRGSEIERITIMVSVNSRILFVERYKVRQTKNSIQLLQKLEP